MTFVNGKSQSHDHQWVQLCEGMEKVFHKMIKYQAQRKKQFIFISCSIQFLSFLFIFFFHLDHLYNAIYTYQYTRPSSLLDLTSVSVSISISVYLLSLFSLRAMSYKTHSIISPLWSKNDIMSVNFNSTGSKLSILKKSQPPTIFNTLQPKAPDLICIEDTGTYKYITTVLNTHL